MQGSVRFVRIPADVSEPLEELHQEFTEDNEVECLLNRLKAYFRSSKRSKTAAQKAAHKAALLANVPEEDRGRISQSMLDAAGDLGLVESVALLSNAKDNGFIGVNLYCDDEGALLQAPINVRASDIASCCGKPLEVRGDAFLARVFDSEEDFKRLDFTMSEVSSSAAWVKAAFEQNERKRKADSAETIISRMQAGSKGKPIIQESSPGESEKNKGNEEYKAGNWREAVVHYSRAIERDKHLLSARNNRAMALLKLEEYSQAETDCDYVILADPTNVKAFLRRAAARSAMQRTQEALEDYKMVVKLEPRNESALQKLKELQPAKSRAETGEQADAKNERS